MSIIGMFVLIAVAIIFSENRKAINIRTVVAAFALQAIFAALVLYVPAGQEALGAVSNSVQNVINYADSGINFLFGDLGRKKLGFIFAFNVLPIIVFFSSLVAVLYYLGIMQKIINVIGSFFKFVMGTGQAESLSATANIFVSQTEAPLVIKPYILGMTRSELFAVMVGGMASIAGSLLVGYANLGVELKYLIASSFMAAPGGLLMAKLVIPETGTPKDALEDINFDNDEKPANVIDAAASGAVSGMKLAVNIGAMLIAFIALIALLNGAFSGISSMLGLPEVTIETMLGHVFSPVAFVLGIPWSEAVTVGSLIGQKLILNEFVAYVNFVELKDTLLPHTQVVVTFALCGFANLSSIAILLGGLGSIAPTRRHEIAKMGLKAVLAATLANLMSAALASLFVT
ncbi:MAG: CNT family concentrative nucleoside transporter [Polaribacter sp.]|jgi:CNT family concentrative nucleoside transporter